MKMKKDDSIRVEFKTETRKREFERRMTQGGISEEDIKPDGLKGLLVKLPKSFSTHNARAACEANQALRQAFLSPNRVGVSRINWGHAQA